MSGSKTIPLEGQLGIWPDDVDVPELLASVCATGKTGRLEVHIGDIEKNVFLDDGEVVFASSSSPDDRLGAYLLQRDELALHDLRRLSAQVRPGIRLGTLLVQHGILPSSGLARAVGGHIKAIVLSLFEWTQLSYAFLEGPVSPEEAIRLSVPTARIIVDGIDQVPSWERIAKGLGSLDERFTIVGGNVESMRSADLDTQSLELLAMLRHPKDVKELCEATDMPDIDVCRKLWAFRVLDWVRPANEASELDLDLEGLGMIFGNEDGH
jgi:hypothetical protein